MFLSIKHDGMHQKTVRCALYKTDRKYYNQYIAQVTGFCAGIVGFLIFPDILSWESRSENVPEGVRWMHSMKLHFQKWDMIAIASVVLLAVLVFIVFLPKGNSPAAYAQIYQDSQLIKTVPLAVDQEFTVTGTYSNTITVRDGKIAVTQSSCPGEDCIRCGWQGGTGRSIVCLPNGLEIRVVTGNSGVDFAVG